MKCYFLNNGQNPKDCYDIPSLMTALKQTIAVRNEMGGVLYCSILSDQVVGIHSRLLELNVTTKEIDDFLTKNA